VPIYLFVLFFPLWLRYTWATVCMGAVPVLLGEGLRLWSNGHIGMSSRTHKKKAPVLITSGPYSLCRNPLYIANIVLQAGIPVLAGLWWMSPVVICLLALQYKHIVRYEESVLAELFGEEYAGYASSVRRWLPTFPAFQSLQSAGRFR